MSGIEYLLTFGKAFFVVMFAMNVAVLLTWTDRRYGSMIQDRVGPNRAVVWLPRNVARTLAVLPALGAAAAILGFAKTRADDLPSKAGNAMFLTQLAIFATWFTGLVIAARIKRRGARSNFDHFVRTV
ncbi:MAG: NADH-quinone oxidoreductase subunit H, partial [Deltaproteobacteria bacterium]|nr:NADH-quinone oxidoreductase subunit H [Deltaproteobacteria bacterium]